eukprot:SAG11_NODE_3318_length_2525_cov_4.934460_2_plen_450_part_00
MPSENKELLLVAQRGSEASSDKENEDHHDNTTKLDTAVRALAHAQTQFDQARVLHAKAASDLDELRDQLNDPSLDPFERELLEEDMDHLTSELARHGRRAEAWESKSTTISAEISDQRARMQATGKCEAETTYNSVEGLEPSSETCDNGLGPSTQELESTADLGEQIDGIDSPKLSTVRPYEIDAAAKAARQVTLEPSPTPQATKTRSGKSVGAQDQRTKGADTARAALTARRNLSSELAPQVSANTDNVPTGPEGSSSQIEPRGTTTGTEGIPATPMAKTNPVTEVGKARKDAEAGQVDCVHGLGEAPRSGPALTIATVPLNADHPVPMQSGVARGLPATHDVQPSGSCTPPPTTDMDETPDNQLPDPITKCHRDAPDGSVPTTAETEKPRSPGRPRASSVDSDGWSHRGRGRFQPTGAARGTVHLDRHQRHARDCHHTTTIYLYHRA